MNFPERSSVRHSHAEMKSGDDRAAREKDNREGSNWGAKRRKEERRLRTQ